MNPNESEIPYEELFGMGVKALELVGVPEEDARITVEILLWADLRGVTTHGINRLLAYIPRLRNGLINPRPKIRVESQTPVTGLVYGDDGLGPVVGTKGMKEAIRKAKDYGIAFVGCRDSNNFGAAGLYV